MTLSKFSWITAAVAGFVLAVTGCGGGSSSTSGSGGNTASGAVQVFAVDDLNTGYAHVWVTLDKIALTTSSGTSTTIFDDSANGGKVVDLRSLHDTTGALYLLLGAFNTPAGTYTGIDVTLSSSLTVVPTGATVGTAATFANASGGTADLTLAFSSVQTISAGNPIVIDFNLANWVLTGTTVSATNNAYLALGTATTLKNPGRQCGGDYDGTVSALSGTAPAQTFTLTLGKSSVNVVTSSTTTIVNSDGSANPALADGERLDVQGTYDATNSVVDATNITIHVGTTETPPARVIGLVTAFDATADTLTVTVQGCNGFQPSSTTLNVTTSSSTTYFGNSGVTDTAASFFAALVSGTTQVEIDGTESGTTVAATNIEIVGPPPAAQSRPLAAQGVAANANANATAGTFDITLDHWEGDQLTKGAVIHVVTTTDTQFFNAGSVSASAAFYAGLTSSSVVSVLGTYDASSSTLTAAIVATGNDGHFHF